MRYAILTALLLLAGCDLLGDAADSDEAKRQACLVAINIETYREADRKCPGDIDTCEHKDAIFAEMQRKQ